MHEIKYRTQFPELLEHFGLKGDAVEIGVAEGRNAAILIASPVIEKLYLIDNWSRLDQAGDGSHPQQWHDNNFKEVHERVEPFKEKAVILKGLSAEMISRIPDNSLIFAYVDGDHSEVGCLSDLRGVYRKVKTGGVIAFHDFLNHSANYGVNRAVHTLLRQYDYPEDAVHLTEEDWNLMMVSGWFIKK
jgi:hypothetical protein